VCVCVCVSVCTVSVEVKVVVCVEYSSRMSVGAAVCLALGGGVRGHEYHRSKLTLHMSIVRLYLCLVAGWELAGTDDFDFVDVTLMVQISWNHRFTILIFSHFIHLFSDCILNVQCYWYIFAYIFVVFGLGWVSVLLMCVWLCVTSAAREVLQPRWT